MPTTVEMLKTNSRLHSTGPLASKFARFKSGRLQCIEHTAGEVVPTSFQGHLDELKHQLCAEWSNLEHVMVTAAIRHSSACVKAAGGYVEHRFTIVHAD